jgi:DNA-directed RNA polymerase subunit RPC12/RpoP
MKRVCAWCGRELDQSERRENMQVTHGVCPICRRRFFTKALAKETDSPPIQEDVSNDPGRTGGQAPTE